MRRSSPRGITLSVPDILQAAAGPAAPPIFGKNRLQAPQHAVGPAKLRSMNSSSSNTLILLADEAQTAALAARFASAMKGLRKEIVEGGLNLRLTGDLGAGKTTFTRALLRGLGVAGRVRSPTFELVEEYDVLESCVFYHFDFYRFEDPREFEEAGFRDLFGPGRITACEWSAKAGAYLPGADLEMTLGIEGGARRAALCASTALGARILGEVC